MEDCHQYIGPNYDTRETNRKVDWSLVRHFGAYGRLFYRENRTCLFDIVSSFWAPLFRFFENMMHIDHRLNLCACFVSKPAP